MKYTLNQSPELSIAAAPYIVTTHLGKSYYCGSLKEIADGFTDTQIKHIFCRRAKVQHGVSLIARQRKGNVNRKLKLS